jgi:hypothetical protein
MTRVLAALALVIGLTACGSNDSLPDVTGVWVGEYQYALADGSSIKATERIVIERQQEELLWGYEIWTDEAGAQQRTELTGTLTNGGAEIVLTERGAYFQGTVADSTMTLTFVRTTKDQHTAFQVTLTRQ